jgi:hypothetical protein
MNYSWISFNARDVRRAWFKLNKRFKAILRSASMYAHLTTKNDYKDYKVCFHNYASQFIYIRIERECAIPETFDLSFFSNIRSLHLAKVTSKQYDQITPEIMPYLTSLTIDEIQANRNPISLLFGNKQFSHLMTCHLPYLFSTNIQLQSCLTLRSLHVNFCTPEVFFGQIKVLLPNLVYFESIFGSSDVDFISNKQSMMTPHNTLRHVKIGLNGDIRPDFLPSLFTVLPELHCVELCCLLFRDYRQLADILKTKLLRLKKFNFTVNRSDYQYLPRDFDMLKQMSPWFAQMKMEKFNDTNRIICYVEKGE